VVCLGCWWSFCLFMLRSATAVRSCAFFLTHFSSYNLRLSRLKAATPANFNESVSLSSSTTSRDEQTGHSRNARSRAAKFSSSRRMSEAREQTYGSAVRSLWAQSATFLLLLLLNPHFICKLYTHIQQIGVRIGCCGLERGTQ
jgi:hypothetical protein